MRQPVEQRRLARIRVAHESNRWYRLLLAPLAQLRPPLPDLADLALDRLDADSYPAAVRFEFRFPRSARPYAAAQPRERGPRACQPRKEVLELCQLHLPLALSRACASSEDVENQLSTIDDFSVELFFELPK